MISEETKSSLRRLLEARQRKDIAQVELDSAKALLQEKVDEVSIAMDNAGIQGGLRVDLGEPWGVCTFSARKTIFGSVLKDQEGEFEDFLREQGQLEEYSEPKFKKRRLNEFAKELIESGGEAPPGFYGYTSRGVTITRQK